MRYSRLFLWAAVAALTGAAAGADEPTAATTTTTTPAPTSTPSTGITVPRSFSLEETIITATRSEIAQFDAPFMTSVIGSELIEQRQYRTLPQILRDVPGVIVQETSPAQGSPIIRGFTGRSNLLLIDGVRVNNSAWRSGPVQYWNTLDSFTIDRLELVKGPSSVLYGSDAIGGTVNVITKSPWTYGEGVQAGAHGYYRVSSAENSHIGRGEGSVTVDETLGFLVGGTGRHFADVIGGEDIGRQGRTGYDEWSSDFKAEYFLDENTRLVAAHQIVRQDDAPRTHATNSAKSFHGTTVGTDRVRDIDEERELTYFQFHRENTGDFIDTFRASVSYQQMAEVTRRITGGGTASREGMDVNTIGLWTQFETPTPFGRLTYGLEYYHDNIESFSTASTVQGPVGDDASYDLLGLYVQDHIEITKQLGVIIGGRFTYAAASVGSFIDPSGAAPSLSLDKDWTAAVGSARVNYEIIEDHVNLYGGVSQGFRAPNIDDLTSNQIARSGELAIANPELDAEYYAAFEAGVKGRTKELSAEVAYYYTDIADAIVSAPTGVILPGPLTQVAKSNDGEGFVQGVEAGAAYTIAGQWTIFGNVSYQDSDITVYPVAGSSVLGHEYLSRTAPLMGQVGVRWEEPANKRFWAEVQVVMSDKADRLSGGDERDTQRIPPGGTPGWAVVHVRGGWRVTDQLHLIAAVENIGDVDYRVHGSGTNMPGRNFIFSLDFRF